ncbi:alpha/beta fold hydrolase [Streptomyces turgidiscabies]|uniref:Hydrolase, alpha/beta domain protein n=1 Tax=Streptomyces turgidiscabies (strain Car8) TaxID=698760 RepID=L7FED0_STRT8|nr:MULTISPECIES: alpha/beta hydrolase [Streptomyces]ELP69035.1 hydrolase, alpha/beta domain protein [Streptomyces turgidiscabies Car8]MDX3498239.1 alpha/beta hydrolase [Streptomyces turgidiscabies]GAQ75212.1 dihydrolipoyllysine-residue acetyltransferase component of pyruvate dehydrogenase complex [Streptomyces turgidiscabies]
MSIWSEPQSDSLFADVDDLRVHYKRAGHGPPVLLLHGSASSLHHFADVAALLAPSYDVIRPDLPGWGLTGARDDRDYRVPTYAATVARFLDVLGVRRCAVVGNSLGGNIAWNLAVDRPERVSHLVLVNALGYPEKSVPAGLRLARNPLLRPVLRRAMPRRVIERNLRSAVGAHSGIVDEAMVERSYELMGRPGNRSAFVDFVNTDQPDRSAEIADIAVPTLVLRSASVNGQHFARDIPGAEELVHPDGGHLLPEEDPHWVGDAIAGFLGSHSDSTQSRQGGRP